MKEISFFTCWNRSPPRDVPIKFPRQNENVLSPGQRWKWGFFNITKKTPKNFTLCVKLYKNLEPPALSLTSHYFVLMGFKLFLRSSHKWRKLVLSLFYHNTVANIDTVLAGCHTSATCQGIGLSPPQTQIENSAKL